jgi:hypothetical protein
MASTLPLVYEQPQPLPATQGSGETLSVLARLCSHTQGRDGQAAVIAALTESRLDWSALLAAASAHSVAPRVCQRLLELPGDGVLPADQHERFRQEFLGNLHRNFLLTAELIRLLRACEHSGLQAVPFKGPVLAQQAYGDLALRQFADLDVVLPHSQIAEAHRVLEGMDYRSENAAVAIAEGRIPGQYAYRNPSRGVLVELHSEKTLRYLPVPLDWKALAARLETVAIAGQSLRTFSTEDTMMLLCVHGTKHFWTRLGWICDIAELAQAPRGIDWPRAGRLALKMRCHRMWLLGLALANHLLAAPLPEAAARQIRRDGRVLALARSVQEQFLRRNEFTINTAERVRFRSNSQDTLATGLRQLSIFATRPTDQDWQSCSLPRWAAPLYAILRPLRILRHHGFGRS